MQVKKFEAPTIQEALETIKRELGPEAIILQTKKNKRGFGLLSKTSVEITAAVSDRSMGKKELVAQKLPAESVERISRLPSNKQADVYDKVMDKHLRTAVQGTQDRVSLSGKQPAGAQAAGRPRYADIQDAPPAQAPARKPPPASDLAGLKIQAEMKELKSLVQHMIREKAERRTEEAPGETGKNPILAEVFEQLVIAGLDRKQAHALVKKASFETGGRPASAEDVVDQVAGEIVSSTETLGWLGAKPMEGPRVLVLVGPTGVGKTTTLAKIASDAILKRGMKVGLINLDSYKVAAFDQLATYARILKTPFRSAASAEDLQAAVTDFQGLDLILVDTTGRSQRDPASLREMEKVLAVIPHAETALVLASTTRDSELNDSASRFSIFHPRGVIFSKLDEATTFGCIYNVSHRAKLPLLYFTTGQRVPEDLEEATPERLAALILDL